MLTEEGESKGFGFVCYKKPESAIAAQKDLHGRDGLYVKRALKKADRKKELQ